MKLVEISGTPLEQALLENTTYYVRIGCHDWKHDRNNLLWRQYWCLVERGEDLARAAYQMYLTDYEKYKDKPIGGCFSYSYYEPEKAVYLHFQNNFANDLSPLAPENLPVRRAELKKIFEEIKEKYPEAKEVEGSSWLYAYDSYKSLFPSEFIANLHPAEPGLKGNGAWGQFLNKDGQMNQKRVDQFLKNVEVSKTKEDLMNAFPIPTYDTSAPIEVFYKFLSI